MSDEVNNNVFKTIMERLKNLKPQDKPVYTNSMSYIINNIPKHTTLSDTLLKASVEELKHETFFEKDSITKINKEFEYNSNANFDNAIRQSCICDGTYTFINELAINCINVAYYLKTELKDYDFILGNFIFIDEYDEHKFATKEKPWLQDKFTIFLPISRKKKRLNYDNNNR